MRIGISGHDILFHTSPKLDIENSDDFKKISSERLQEFYKKEGVLIMRGARAALKRMSQKHELFLLMDEEGSEYISSLVHTKVNYFKGIYFGDTIGIFKRWNLDMIIDSDIRNVDACEGILFNPYGWYDNLHKMLNYKVIKNWSNLREFQ